MQHSQKSNLPASVKAAGVAVAAIIGAFLSRWHGGGFISGSPKLLKAFLWSAPFSAATWLAFFLNRRDITDWLQEHIHRLSYHPFDFELLDIWVPIIAAIIVLLGCMVFKNTGHGGGMDLAHSEKEPGGTPSRTPEKLEYLILLLHDKMPRYWYDFLLLAIIGFFSTLFPAIAFGVVDILAGMILLAGGAFGKPVGYAIGWALHDAGLVQKLPDDLDEGTAVGEALTGFFAFGSLAIATVMVVF